MSVDLYPIDDDTPIGALAEEDESFIDSGLSVILRDPDLVYQYLAIISTFVEVTIEGAELPSVIDEFAIMDEIEDIPVDLQPTRIYLANCPFNTCGPTSESESSTALLISGGGGGLLLIAPGGGAMLVAP